MSNDLSGDFATHIPRLTLPLSIEKARALKLGELYVLDGEVTVTAGFSTHQRMVKFLKEGHDLPLDMKGGAFFHMGSCCHETDAGWLPDYVNPTTSTRFNAFMPTIIRGLGLTAVGGKGGLDEACVAVLRETGCVYFSMPGGASPLLSRGAEKKLATGWDDLIEQFRLSRFRLNGFGPVTVAIDAHGNSMYRNLKDQAVSRMPAILKELEQRRTDRAG
ncbi:MAG: fumarate hydratase C-terminal domain-containing protein [Pseudolabrys sp.]